ncbi:protein downstream neighbor of Son [Panicum miliaceum]|uniref:Protein downstream neighbor of Son n=1 Tax=Panicum miliaceum TaxID=4540 RepID=A0A3L6T249_PANMI|nr:protein downstream neighbor of Son [Panicum miliaceum]
MAQAAVESALNGDSLIGRQAGLPRMKRKTPSELRGEQLKRRTSEKLANDQLPSPAAFDRSSNGLRNTEQQKISKYINTRVTEVFPVRKARNLGKENCKDALQSNEKICKTIDATTVSNFASSSLTCGNGDSAKLDSSVPSTTEAAKPGFKKVEKCSENALRSVSELHVGDEKQTGSNKFDMEKVLKGFGARDAFVASGLSKLNVRVGDAALKSSDVCPSKITIPGKRAPLDFTLKTSLQFVSSSSVKWCHKLNTSFGRSSITGAIGQSCLRGCQNLECPKPESKKEFLFSKALQSWVYPQSLLPSSIISAMLSSTARGENDFLLKRHQDWEDSFQNLYYMLRKNMLNIFYFYTTQFVALFIGGSHLEKKQSCNAYLSQSTRGLRSLLRKHGVCFSMPLCNTEVEQATEDDLIELSEIQRRNFGQALHLDALSDVDNTTQSLLTFTGNESVHGLYDILLNYKSLLNSLSAVDVPVLYSPQPFQNGCLHIPEVKCREMRRADMGLLSSGGFDTEPGSAFASTAGNICYSMEIKDPILPPWVVSGVCAAMSSDARSFDLTIATEPSSMGLNAALKSMTTAPQPETVRPTDGGAPVGLGGIPNAVLVPSFHSASLRRLSYTDGEYVAYTIV